MADYKGIYYKRDNNKHDNKQKFFEGGAHFKYITLYRILRELHFAQVKRMNKEKWERTKETEEMKSKKELQKKKQEEQISKNINNNIINVSIFKI